MFTRIGDATDVVTKEMYDFVDKGERHISLRPELTASVCRSFAQHRPTTPWKVFYAGSNFRYEKPQRGRYRQFDQVGIEVLGVDDAQLDVEVIALAWEFYRRLGLRQVNLIVNSLGEPDERGPLRRVAAGVLRRRRRRAHRTEPGDARPQPAARARLQAGGRSGPHRRRARRSATSAVTSRRHTSRRCSSVCWRSTSRSPSSRNSCADSTTTAARSSSSRVARSTRRRTPSAAVDATTAWSRRSADRRHLVSDSPSGSTERCWPATTRGSSPPSNVRSTPSWSTWSVERRRPCSPPNSGPPGSPPTAATTTAR